MFQDIFFLPVDVDVIPSMVPFASLSVSAYAFINASWSLLNFLELRNALNLMHQQSWD